MREIGTWRGTKPTKTEGGLGEEGEIGVGNVLATRTISHPEIGDKKNGLSGRRDDKTTGHAMPSPTACFLPVRKRTRGAAAPIGMLARARTMNGSGRIVCKGNVGVREASLCSKSSSS